MSPSPSTFTDSQNRSWSMKISLATLRRVKAAASIDLLTIFEPGSGALAMLREDPVMLFAVLVAVLQPQLEAEGLSEDEFGDALLEEHAQQAVYALLSGVIDYFPPNKQASLRTLLETTIKAAEAVRAKATRELQRVVATLDVQALQAKIEQGIERNLARPVPAAAE